MNKVLALAAVLAAPSLAFGAKTEAILAFDDGGSEAVRYYARKGALRVALPGEPDKLVVDAVKGSPEVTAILVGFPGAPAPDKDEAEGRLFAFGDTVNARVRQASGGKRGITGGIYGPVTVDAVSACDLNRLLSEAISAAKIDLSKTDVALVLAPQAACRFSGAATLGRVHEGKKRLAVAWAFGDNWVAASAHAIEHAMGTRHAAAPASDDFGWAAASSPKETIAKKMAPKGTLIAMALPERAEEGLRDAPAAMRPAALGMRPAAAAGVAGSRMIDRSSAPKPELPSKAEPRTPGEEAPVITESPAKAETPVAPRKAKAPKASASIDAATCKSAARNLRDAAKGASVSSAASALVARRRLASIIKDVQGALASKEISMNADVSLLTTDAETELHVALMKLQDVKTSAKSIKDEVLPAIGRAAASLDEAARGLSRR
ncbi:MAG: hypothetical protein HY925_07245 [Elusimicrobia bacterium]|nr:hypothetical protein [Elusimicrobiota bacterium]